MGVHWTMIIIIIIINFNLHNFHRGLILFCSSFCRGHDQRLLLLLLLLQRLKTGNKN